MATQEELILTKEGISVLAKEIFEVVNNRIADRIVSDIDENSDNNHVPSAAAVYESVNGVNNIKNLVVASGNPAEANITPDTKTIYMVRKSANATEAIPYVYVEGVGYIAAQPRAAIESIPNLGILSSDDISEAVAEAASSTTPTI